MQDVNDATLAVFTNNSIHPLRHRSPANVAYFSVPLHLPPVASKQQQKNIERCLVAVNTACHRGQGIAEASDELIYEVTEALLQSHMPPVCYGVGQQRLSFMPSHPLAKALDDWYSHGRCCKYCLIDHNQEVTCHEVWISLRNEKLSARSESLSVRHTTELARAELINISPVVPLSKPSCDQRASEF